MLKRNRSAWKIYTSLCMSTYKKRLIAGDIPHPNLFVELQADIALCRQIIDIYDAAPYQEFSTNFERLYKAPSKPNSEEYYEKFSRHKVIDGKLSELIQGIFIKLQSQIENVLGYHTALANVRLFDLNRGAPNTVHTDNFPCGLYKILVYLSGASNSTGTTAIQVKKEIKAISGKIGHGILFDSNNLYHSSIAPTKEVSRKTIEFTIMPSLFSAAKIPQPGLIATYPLYPPGYMQNEFQADGNSNEEDPILKNGKIINQFKPNLYTSVKE